LKTLKKHHIKAALFVCGMRVADSNGQRLIKAMGRPGSYDLQPFLFASVFLIPNPIPLKSSAPILTRATA
jgi:hypothetical protein